MRLQRDSRNSRNRGRLRAEKTSMLPRCVLPGVTYLLTRRCLERRFLLRPSKQTNQIVEYCLAIAAERTGVRIHAYCAMSNHLHLVVSDVEGRLPEFMHFAYRHIAVAMNAVLGRSENFFAAGQPSAVVLGDASDVLEKMAYVIANPTTAGSVASPRQWPGAITETLGETRMISRPSAYFRENGLLPAEAPLRCDVPPQLDHLSAPEAAQRLEAAVSEKVRAARSIMKKERRSFLGREKVLRLRRSQAGKARERSGGRVPQFAMGDPKLRKLALERWKAFLVCYRAAYARWRMGERSAVFPPGTWKLRRDLCIRCHEPPSALAA